VREQAHVQGVHKQVCLSTRMCRVREAGVCEQAHVQGVRKQVCVSMRMCRVQGRPCGCAGGLCGPALGGTTSIRAMHAQGGARACGWVAMCAVYVCRVCVLFICLCVLILWGLTMCAVC